MFLQGAIGAVNALKEAGITLGKAVESFGSTDLITRGELAIWIERGFELEGRYDTSLLLTLQKKLSTCYSSNVNERNHTRYFKK